MKIIISGGHLTPALAVIDVFQRSHPDVEIVFIGREYAQELEGMKSKEREEMEKRKIPFYAISAAKFHRTYFLRNIGEFFRIFPSLREVQKIFATEKPDLFLSFGGYLAVPIALICKLKHIPVITHEQTRAAGLANTLIAQLADVVAISHEQTRNNFPKKKVVVTGNPLRPAFLVHHKKNPEWLGRIPHALSVIYVTGGSQGSHVINQNIARIIGDLVKKAVVVHQCGASNNSTYLREMEEVRSSLPKNDQKNYIIREWISEDDVAWLFQHVDLVVARSGANTVQESVISKVPSIFIPLPFSHANEQLKNANWLAQTGGAVVLPQKDLTPSVLLSTISSCLRKKTSMRNNVESASKEIDVDASDKLADLCRKVYAQSFSQSL